MTVPGTADLESVSCTSAQDCYAVGDDNAEDDGTVTTITNSTAGPSEEVPNDGNTPWLNAISCPTATQCYAAGLVSYEPAIVLISSGVPSAAVDVSNGWYLSGIDCPAAGPAEPRPVRG